MKQLFDIAPFPQKKQLFRGRRRIVISWHRFYDPETGRYISADPIGLAGGMNLYNYVGGNPVNLIDPEGLQVTKFCTNWSYIGEQWLNTGWRGPTQERVLPSYALLKILIQVEFPRFRPGPYMRGMFNVMEIFHLEEQALYKNKTRTCFYMDGCDEIARIQEYGSDKTDISRRYEVVDGWDIKITDPNGTSSSNRWD